MFWVFAVGSCRRESVHTWRGHVTLWIWGILWWTFALALCATRTSVGSHLKTSCTASICWVKFCHIKSFKWHLLALQMTFDCLSDIPCDSVKTTWNGTCRHLSLRYSVLKKQCLLSKSSLVLLLYCFVNNIAQLYI